MATRRLSVVVDSPVVALCVGKDCRKQSDHAKLQNALDARCDLVELKCVGVCSGPVMAVLDASGSPTVYAKLRGKRHRSLVLSMLGGDRRATRELAKRRVTKKKAIGLVMRQLKRRSGDIKRAA